MADMFGGQGTEFPIFDPNAPWLNSAGAGGGSGNEFGFPMPSSNQYFNPGVPGNYRYYSSANAPANSYSAGTVPPSQGDIVPPTIGGTGVNFTLSPLADGFKAVGEIDPALTQALLGYLQGQVGKGATPFNLQTPLPSGGMTQPGQLSAPLNELMQRLQKFYQGGGGGGIPGLDTLSEFSKTGLPIDQMPAWKAMVEAQQRNIKQNQAQLKEQFASAGDIASSPYAQAATDYQTQTVKDQDALLAQMEQQAMEAARGRQMDASQVLSQGATGLATILQGLDQQAIQNLLQEFIRTQPEYSPLLNMLFAGATTFPPVVHAPSGTSSLGSILGGIGSLIPGVGSVLKLLGGGGDSGGGGGGGSDPGWTYPGGG